MSERVFYEDRIDPSFRFGDVLKGFVSSTPNLHAPPLTPNNMDYSIAISLPSYCAIISPCCSIADQVISLSPLIRVRNAFFNNPYFEENLTRINRLVPPENSLPPIAWEKMSEEEQQERLNSEMFYTFVDLFVYEEHEMFTEYEVHRKNANNILTRYYMVDFRNTFKVNCSEIRKPNEVPIETKCLQLTIETRQELRDKITYYYNRPAVEDIID